MKKTTVILLAMVLVLSVAACASPAAPVPPAQDGTDSAPPLSADADLMAIYAGINSGRNPDPVSTLAFPLEDIGDRELTIGIAARNMSAGFFYALHTSIQQTLESYGATAILANADDDAVQQVAQIDNFIAQGVDGIVINVTDPAEGVAMALDRAAAAGIPVMGVDTILVDTESFLGHVGGDNFLLGRGIGVYVAERLLARDGEVSGNVAILNGFPNPIADLRIGGFWDGIESVAPDHTLVEVAFLNGGTWTIEAGVTMGEDVLVAHPHLDVIMGTADPFVVGAMEAARRLGRDEMIMGAVDGSRAALDLVAEGGPVGVITLQDPIGLGQLSARILLNFIVNGDTPEYRLMSLEHPVATFQNIAELADSAF